MKITKEQLTQIIKEEIAEVLNEISYNDYTRADKFREAGASTASHLGALGPPTAPPRYLPTIEPEELCAMWKANFEASKEDSWNAGFSFRKADSAGCEWIKNMEDGALEALRQKYPDPYAHIGKKVTEDIKEQ
jgi:hypothetical protein